MNRLHRFDRLRRMGCICCRLMGYFNDQIDVHHIVDRGYRDASGGDNATLPLCLWHHRGARIFLDLTPIEHQVRLGPSLALNKRAFREHFGDQRDLLKMVDEMVPYPNTARYLGLLNTTREKIA